MSRTFIISQDTDLTLQQGDTGSIQFTIDSKLNLSTLVNPVILFQVFRGSTLAFEKKDADWTISAQDISAELAAADTQNLYGGYSWGLRITHEGGIHTVGKGSLQINRKPLTT